MVQVAENVRIWEGCAVYFGPLGTTPPTDLTTAPSVEWLDAGVCSADDGGQQAVDVETTTFNGRVQAGVIPARSRSQFNSRTITVALLEDNPNVTKLLEPLTTRTTDGVSGVTTIQHRQGSGKNEIAVLLDRWDGSEMQSQYIVARAQVNPNSLANLFGSEPSVNTVDLQIFPAGDGLYATEITNDPAQAATP